MIDVKYVDSVLQTIRLLPHEMQLKAINDYLDTFDELNDCLKRRKNELECINIKKNMGNL